MKNYRLLKSWETPFDGDIAIIKEPIYSMRDNVFRINKRACRVSGFRNSCMTGLLTDCKDKVRWCCLVNNPQIIKVYRKI